MRKFLSLVLALVMMMSLVTINAGAKEFTDDSDITYQEAVDVISTIKVVDGYDNGSYNPKGNLTRGAAAKIICNLILGPTTAAELHADTAPFRDVPVTHDFAGYIAYCQKEGIISGYADGSFRPAGTLTGYAFMKMLLGALGYDSEIEGFVGPNWSINVAKKAIGIGLNRSLEGDFNGVNYITREEAALYAFNTLRTDLVEYDQKITASVNGAEVTVGNSLAKAQTWNNSLTRHNNIRDDEYIQFAEQYFNKLVLTEAEDVFGRPDREWKYDGDEIGTYINYDLFKQEYTTKVTGKQLRDLLGGTVVDEYKFNIAIDGIEAVSNNRTEDQNKTDLGDAFFTQGNMVRTNTEKVGETGNGVLTQVFVDNDRAVEKVWVAVINTYLAKATSDYNEKKEEVDFEVWSVNDVRNNKNDMTLVKDTGETEILTVSNEDINVEDIKENDIVLVHVAEGEIKEILDPELVDETEITSFKEGSWVNAGGTQYDYADPIQYDPEVLDDYDDYNMKDTTYRVYLDEYGYAIGVEIVEATAQYVFVTGIDKATHNLTNKTADGNVIHLDGTMETVKIDMKKSVAADGVSELPVVSLLNTWCKYTVNSNGTYTLTEIANDQDSFRKDDRGNVYSKADKTDKVGQGRDIAIASTGTPDNNDDTNPTTPADFMTLDKSHIYLSSVIPAFKTVYTNDDTVFITATVGQIQASEMYSTTPYTDWNANLGTGYVAAIDDVDTVTVGARNVNLKVWNAAKVFEEGVKEGTLTSNVVAYTDNPFTITTETDLRKVSSGAYTLFSDKGYVIATVVVGEDDGSTTNYAFVTSGSMNQEAYSKADDEYTWSREVIVNGQLVDLIEKGDNRPEIKGMTKGNWYEVKYKGDGTVRSVTNLSTNSISGDRLPNGNLIGCPVQDFDAYLTDENGANAYVDSKYIQSIVDYEKAVDENDTVLLWDNLTDVTYEISVEGNTLQVENASGQKNGFSVSGDCKVVLIQDTNPSRSNVKYIDDIEEYSKTGTDGLKAMINDLNNNKAFVGFIGAIFEGKLATSVVIYDKTETEVDEGSSSMTGSGSSTSSTIKGVDITIKKPAGNGQASNENASINVTKSGELTISVPVGAENNASTAKLTLKVNGVDVSYKLGDAKFVNGNLVFDTTNLDLEEGDVVEVTVDEVNKNAATVETNPKIAAGVTTVTETNADGKYSTGILTPGVYQFPSTVDGSNSTFVDALGDIRGGIENNLFFRYDIPAGKAYAVTLAITKDNAPIYEESSIADDNDATGGTALKKIFYVQILGENPMANKGSGSLKTTALTAGNYTWTIVGTAENETVDLGHGSFTIR